MTQSEAQSAIAFLMSHVQHVTATPLMRSDDVYDIDVRFKIKSIEELKRIFNIQGENEDEYLLVKKI